MTAARSRRAVVRRLTTGAHAFASVALAGATLSGCAADLPAVPDTPAGRALGTWLAAYNAADSARLDAYARRFEPAMSVHAQLATRAQTGPYDVVAVARSDPGHLEVILRTRAASTVGLTPLAMYGLVDVAEGRPGAGTPVGGAPAGGATARAPSPTTIRLTFLGPDARILPRVGAAERAVAVDSVVAKVVRNYVVPDVARRVADSLRARWARGAYDEYATAVGFAHRLNSDLRELGGDAQLGVEYAWALPLPAPKPTPAAWLHCGIGPAALLEDSVGYVPVYGFGDQNPFCGQQVSATMQALAAARALVLDLRDAEDESRSGMAYFASYLVAGCTHLSDLRRRRTGHVEALYTHDGLPGPAFGGTKPLVLLTSARTFAAAEALASSLQALGRATVVGERTGGGAGVTAVGSVGEHLLVRVPVARAVNPVTGATWQGTGVAPDVEVPAAEALVTARRLLAQRRVRAGRVAHNSAGVAGAANPLSRSPLPRGPLSGIRFAVDTLEVPGEWRSPLTRVVGVVEFAAGRGRLDVTAVRKAPAVAVHGIAVAEPLARPGDYYLFDNTGFLLVRPVLRMFAHFAVTRADYNHTGALLPGAVMFGRDVLMGTGTQAVAVADARRQHAPFAVHWHMQPQGQLGHLDGRGWLEVADAPAVEGGVARWFEVAAALATRPGGVRGLPPDGMEVTSVFVLPRSNEAGVRTPPTGFLEMLAPRRLTTADVDPTRLVLPAGYTETRWPGFAGAPGAPPPSQIAAVHWQTLEDESRQRERAACRQAWLPEPAAQREAGR